MSVYTCPDCKGTSPKPIATLSGTPAHCKRCKGSGQIFRAEAIDIAVNILASIKDEIPDADISDTSNFAAVSRAVAGAIYKFMTEDCRILSFERAVDHSTLKLPSPAPGTHAQLLQRVPQKKRKPQRFSPKADDQ